jgi:hypothetical protein
LQKAIASILLLCFLGQTFNQGFYYLDYMFRKKAYVEKCINKARPKMHCDGKCQLMKKIEEQEKKEQGQAPQMKLANKAEVLSSKSWYGTITSLSIIDVVSHYNIINDGSPIDQPSFIFHPPGA